MLETVDGILLVYHYPLIVNAVNLMEHVESFERLSRFPVVKVNTEYGFPAELKNVRFRAIVLHYSLFGATRHLFDDEWYEYFDQHSDCYKIAFKQDEFHGCDLFFGFLNDHRIDCVFSIYNPKHWDQHYRKNTQVSNLVFNLPGYISSDLAKVSQLYSRPWEQRSIDFGHRARRLPFCMGRGSQEKWTIARDFIERTKGMNLKLDLSWQEKDRIYGNRWFQWLGNCKAMLGAEGGTSITDLDGSIQRECDAYLQNHPKATFEEISRDLLYKYEDNLPYRTMSPQRFEAAAMRTCQLLFEGEYDGVLKPWEHYLPLKRDWSNFDQLMKMLYDPTERNRIVETAYRDLIASGDYSYSRFIEKFDQHLVDAGCELGVNQPGIAARLSKISNEQHRLRRGLWAKAYALRVLNAGYWQLGFVIRRFPRSWRRAVRRALGLRNPGDPS